MNNKKKKSRGGTKSVSPPPSSTLSNEDGISPDSIGKVTLCTIINSYCYLFISNNFSLLFYTFYRKFRHSRCQASIW